MENPIKMDDLGLIILIISVQWFFFEGDECGKANARNLPSGDGDP